MHRQAPKKPTGWVIFTALVCSALWLGCDGGATEQQAQEELRKLGALVVPDVNKRASSLVLPTEAEKIEQAVPWIPKLVYLTSFSGINTPVTDEVMMSVGKLRRLTNVDLSGTAITDKGVGHLSGLSKLSSLTLAESQVTNGCMVYFPKLRNLEILNLSNTQINGNFEELAKCKKLTWLVLSHVKLSDADAAAIADCPNLKRLSISSEVEISDAGKRSLLAQGIQLDLADSPAAGG